MNTQNPQEAFLTWLGQSLTRALEALRAPDREGRYLAGSVDHADLERRFRSIQHRSPSPLGALTQHHS